MAEYLRCPVCGSTEFEQDRTVLYDELCVVSFNLQGEIEDENIETSEYCGEDSAGAYQCVKCDWILETSTSDAITEPDDIVHFFKKASASGTSSDAGDEVLE